MNVDPLISEFSYSSEKVQINLGWSCSWQMMSAYDVKSDYAGRCARVCTRSILNEVASDLCGGPYKPTISGRRQ